MKKVKKQAKKLTTAIFLAFLVIGLVGVLPVPVLANHNMQFDVDKPNSYYTRGSTVTFSIKNVGNDDAVLDCLGIYVVKYDKAANTYTVVATETGVDASGDNTRIDHTKCKADFSDSAYTMKPGDTHVWKWYQKYKLNGNVNNGMQAADGVYLGGIMAYNAQSNSAIETVTSQFTIANDQDNDGIADPQDNDRDGDGLNNDVDSCPDSKAKNDLNNNGCDDSYETIDSDGDGIPDVNDQCDFISSTDQSGCPAPNVIDIKQKITAAGGAWECALTNSVDGDCDGVPDSTDDCPDVAGMATSNSDGKIGCPRTTQEKNAAADHRNKAAGGSMIATGGAIAATVLCGPLVVYCAPIIALIGVTMEVAGVWGVTAPDSEIINDPPNLNYKARVGLSQTQIKPLTEADVPQEVSYALPVLNNILIATRNYKDAVHTYVSANEKYMGAAQEKDYYWMNVHAKEVRTYASLIVEALNNLNRAQAGASQLMKSAGVGSTAITKEKLVELQNNVQINGASALPAFELNVLRNNLYGTTADEQALVDTVLGVDLNTNTLVGKDIYSVIAELTKANSELASTFEHIAVNFGSNVVLDEVQSSGPRTSLFGKTIAVNLVGTPSDTRTLILGVSYDSKKSKFVAFAPSLPTNSQYFAEETEPGKILIMVYSDKVLPAGTTEKFGEMKFVVKGLGMASAIFGKWDVRAQVSGVAGDATDWLYASRKYLKTHEQLLQNSMPVFKNGAWVLVNGPTTLPPSDSIKYYTSWWDGSAWITSPPPQYGVVWTGTGWSGTGPGTLPPKGVTYIDSATLVGKINAWNGYQYVLADKAVVDAALLPSAWPVFDVGTKAWTFTNQMPPASG